MITCPLCGARNDDLRTECSACAAVLSKTKSDIAAIGERQRLIVSNGVYFFLLLLNFALLLSAPAPAFSLPWLVLNVFVPISLYLPLVFPAKLVSPSWRHSAGIMVLLSVAAGVAMVALLCHNFIVSH